MNVVDRMARLAMIAHNGVNRKGPGNKPYIVHPHAVVAILKEWGYTEQDDAVTLAVAWGHDILEDTEKPESAILAVDDVLGPRILAGIKMLTFKPGVSSAHPDYGRLKADYIANVARDASPEIVVVKIADRLCNTLDYLADGEAEHAHAYLGYGSPLRGRIGDCKYAAAITSTWHMVESCV
ncbi:MAG: bifunctional (p)ppGpp synthetase/guanosine-3',5'-bis(diphosphate) 3'-pyrophosphohydrolase [Kiritimatiellae bacterium]|nr:bifunctional (p)ppGpp synthetase/guanosine-3',5'-bis(diphosphate) 3'-pyrophosphohydrolase [Kiritimatiellia bacterium]